MISFDRLEAAIKKREVIEEQLWRTYQAAPPGDPAIEPRHKWYERYEQVRKMRAALEAEKAKTIQEIAEITL